MRPIFMFCAETVIRDADSNNVSATNIFEELRPPNLPIIVPKMTVLSLVARDAGDPEQIAYSLRVTLGGNMVFEQPGIFDFQGRPKLRSIMVFGGMPLTQPGTLEFVIFVGGQVFQTYEVLIQTPQAPVAQQQQLPMP